MFRVHEDITDEALKGFITGEKLTVNELERVSKDNSWTKSYRVVVGGDDLSMILEPDFWPEGIGCRRYWRKKTQATL